MSPRKPSSSAARPNGISPPLPLPIHFTLLPSLSPTKSLMPLLYVLVNDLPVYLTLDSTTPPSLSLLPLLLALCPCSSPLQLISQLRLSPTAGDVSLDLNGTAPFADLWVPIATARRVINELGCERLFVDWKAGRQGMLSKDVESAVSWDDGGGVGHNWLPNTSAIAPSSYSLHTLLHTPFSSISLIPDDRCLTTPIDPSRRAHIRRVAEFEDPSRIRQGEWARAWDALHAWTLTAWSDYQLYPSSPPAEKRSLRLIPSHAPHGVPDLAYQVLSSLSSLSSSSASSSTFTPSRPDLRSLLSPPPLHPPPPTLAQLLTLIVTYILAILHRFHMLPSTHAQAARAQIDGSKGGRERFVRLQLGAVELLGRTLVERFTAQREMDRLRAALEGKATLPPVVVLGGKVPHPTPATPDKATRPQPQSSASEDEAGAGRRKVKKRWREKEKDVIPEIAIDSEGDGTELSRDAALDELDRLERRRGGSPPPPPALEPERDALGLGLGLGGKVPRERSESAATVRPAPPPPPPPLDTTRRRSASVLPPPPSPLPSPARRKSTSTKTAHNGGYGAGDISSADDEEDIWEDVRVVARGAVREGKELVLRSDSVGLEWWIYVSVVAVGFVAAAMGFLPLV